MHVCHLDHEEKLHLHVVILTSPIQQWIKKIVTDPIQVCVNGYHAAGPEH